MSVITSMTGPTRLLTELWLCSESVSQRIDHSLGAVHGIAYVEYLVLRRLADEPGGAMRRVDLARAVRRSASGITRLLRPMEKIGLVERRSSERDARVSFVALTDAGREKLHDADASFSQLCERLTDGLDSSAVTLVREALQALGGDRF